MSAQELLEREMYPLWWKPKGCPIRNVEPEGPMKGCEDACRVFETCIELTRKERAFEEWRRKALDRLERESLNRLQA